MIHMNRRSFVRRFGEAFLVLGLGVSLGSKQVSAAPVADPWHDLGMGTSWDRADADPIADLRSMSDLIRKDYYWQLPGETETEFLARMRARYGK